MNPDGPAPGPATTFPPPEAEPTDEIAVDDELGVVAKVIAVPLTPFVVAWEGTRVTITHGIPAASRQHPGSRGAVARSRRRGSGPQP